MISRWVHGILVFAPSTVMAAHSAPPLPRFAWCENHTGTLSPMAVDVLAAQSVVVLGQDMNTALGANETEEAKVSLEALRLKRASSNRTHVLIYNALGCLLTKYATWAEWQTAHTGWLLHDEAGVLVERGSPADPTCRAWVDFAQPAAAAAWVASMARWVGASTGIDGLALDGGYYDDEFTLLKGRPGPLANVSGAYRAAWLAGLNASTARLGRLLSLGGGELIINGAPRPGSTGLLFEEWCGEQYATIPGPSPSLTIPGPSLNGAASSTQPLIRTSGPCHSRSPSLAPHHPSPSLVPLP
jgi:hypothetical protein